MTTEARSVENRTRLIAYFDEYKYGGRYRKPEHLGTDQRNQNSR